MDIRFFLYLAELQNTLQLVRNRLIVIMSMVNNPMWIITGCIVQTIIKNFFVEFHHFFALRTLNERL